MTQPKIDHLEAVRADSITQPTIDGTAFYAFRVRPGDVQAWDSANIGPNGKPNERAELSFAAAPGPQKVNSPYNVTDKTGKQTYDIDYRCKAGWPAHDPAAHAWAMITQFHPQDDNPSGFKGFTGVSVHGMEITLENPEASGSYFAREPVPVETTIRRRLVVNWSSKADGYVKWVDRATGELIGRYDGPTIATGEFKYVKQGYYRAGGLPDATMYSTLVDISSGDLTDVAPAPTPVPVPVPTPTPAPVDVVDPKKAQAGLQALVDTRKQLEAVTLPQLDAEIASLMDRRKELQARRDQIATVLDAGDWGGGVVAK